MCLVPPNKRLQHDGADSLAPLSSPARGRAAGVRAELLYQSEHNNMAAQSPQRGA